MDLETTMELDEDADDTTTVPVTVDAVGDSDYGDVGLDTPDIADVVAEYLNMAEQSNGGLTGTMEGGEEIQGREYQMYLIRLAKQRNIIACLPTGAGKTFIAVQLAKYYLPEAIKQQRKIIFLANEVLLAHQQASYFKARLSNGILPDESQSVECLTGDLDFWGTEEWNEIFSKRHVLVMTTGIFSRALDHAYIRFDQVMLLILDECHHAVGDSGMNKVMKFYKEIRNGGEVDLKRLPRVLGLTATIIMGKGDVDNVGNEVKLAEDRLCAKAVTYYRYEEVMKHSACTPVDFVTYSKNGNAWAHYEDYLWKDMNRTKDQISAAIDRLAAGEGVGIKHESFHSKDQLFSKKLRKKLKFLTAVINDVAYVYSEFGLYCARWTAIHKRAYLYTEQFSRRYPEVENLIRVVDTALELFITKADKVMGWGSDEEDDSVKLERLNKFKSDKVEKVVKALEEYRSNGKLRGLIFTTQRVAAQSLCWYLQDLASLSCSKLSFLKAGFVVGLATYGRDPVEARASLQGYRDVMESFRKGGYNLLVATSVLEEGLDVPDCNLVVRVDQVPTYPSYIQSRGRARHKDSKFLSFIDASNEEDEKKTYRDYEEYNSKLSDHLRKNAVHADDQFEESERSWGVPEDDVLPAFNPGGTINSPRITASSAIGITQMYCQTLPCDRFAQLGPEYWWVAVKENDKTKFKAFVQFPRNAVIREVVEGELQDKKVLAKRSAALKACKLLYEKGVLNERLLPIRRKMTTDFINKFMEGISTEKEREGNRKVGTKKRTQWYPKKIPECLKEPVIQEGVDLHAYLIRIDLVGSNESPVSQLYKFREREFSYCILSATAALSKIPPLKLKVSNTIGKVTFEEIMLQNKVFSDTELQKLWEFHRYLFGELLKLGQPFMKHEASSLLMAPLRKQVEGNFEIHWELMEKVAELPKDFYKPPSEEERRSFRFDAKRYTDTVVVPWYDSLNLFHVVLDVLNDKSPSSVFPNLDFRDYETYFRKQFPDTVSFIGNKTQPLIRVKPIGSNLNFFTPGISTKKSELERKQDSDRSIELIPELVVVHPLPASLYIQAKFLPSIIQRVRRLLCADEVRTFVATGTPWFCFALRDSSAEEESAFLKRRYETSGNEPPKKKVKTDSESKELDAVSRTLQNGCPSNSVVTLSRATSKERIQKNDYVLDLMHPDKLSRGIVDIIKRRNWSSNRTNNRVLPGNIGEQLCKKTVGFDLNRLHSLPLRRSFGQEFAFKAEEQPSLFKIMQAITLDGSQDFVNLERLEMIGDSFLKYAVSRYIFTHFVDLDEGELTEFRSNLISNRYLFSHGNKFPLGSLGSYLVGGKFLPKFAWLPPGFDIAPKLVQALIASGCNDNVLHGENSESLEKMTEVELHEWTSRKKSDCVKIIPDVNVGYAHGRVGDKSIADCMEALIGAYFVSGGVGAALHVMKKLGLCGPKDIENDVEGIPFDEWGVFVPSYEPSGDLVTNHLPRYQELERIIGYDFKNPWLLVEAFTHACYMRNRITASYERLEFIGDAVLDFVITNYIYDANESLNPGQLTDLRSALVNNVTFGSLAVRYGLHTYLLSNDKTLDNAIAAFARLQEENGHEVTGHFELLSDADCAIVRDVDCPKVLGDVFESLAGAVFVDSGMSLDTVWRIFSRLMSNEIELFSANVPTSPVRVVNEMYGPKVFVDMTEQMQKKDSSGKFQGQSCVALILPVKTARGENIPVVGIGKNKSSAKLAAAKYYNKILNESCV